MGSGFFLDDHGNQQAFFGHEVAGRWENVQTNPSVLGPSNALAESCVSSSDCAVVADEVNGTWGRAHRLPGPASTGNNSGAHVACWSAGNCTAGAAIITSGHLQALVAAEKS